MAAIHGSRGDPPHHADKQAHRHHRANGDNRGKHNNSRPSMPEEPAIAQAAPATKSSDHPDTPAKRRPVADKADVSGFDYSSPGEGVAESRMAAAGTSRVTTSSPATWWSLTLFCCETRRSTENAWSAVKAKRSIKIPSAWPMMVRFSAAFCHCSVA